MTLYSNEQYMKTVKQTGALNLPWEKLKNKRLMLSGATGMLGSFLVDVIFEKNRIDKLNCSVYALGRDEQKTKKRFSEFYEDECFNFVQYNAKDRFVMQDIGAVDFVLHLASNTHPVQYATDPIGTITTNVIGLQNLLDFAVEHHSTRFLYASSNEIYGENRGDVELFDENYCGYINSNTLRAGYTESKRCGEALCQAYISQKNLNAVIVRFTRSYGPTMLMTDTKAISQFIKKGLSGENIVLKSSGTQYFSYTYVADAISGLLTVLLKGENGEAYNIADEQGDIMLKDLASLIAGLTGKDVIFEIPDAIEAAGYSMATKARLDGSKVKKLGWKAKYTIETGITETLEILGKGNS